MTEVAMQEREIEEARPGTKLRQGDLPMSPPQRAASQVAALLLFLAGLFTLKEFLPALVWTLVFAIALWPLFARLAARWPRHRRRLLPALFVLGVGLIFVVPVVLVAVPLAADAHGVAEWVAQLQKSGQPPPRFLGRLPEGQKLISLWQQKLGQPGQVFSFSTGAMNSGAARVVAVIGKQTAHRLVLFGFMLLGLFFLLRDADDVVAQLRVGSRRAFGEAGEDVGLQIVRSVHGTVNGLVLVGLGEGVLLGLAYWIAGVPDTVLFGLLTAILAMIPFGAALAIGVAAAALLASGGAVAAIVIVAFGAIVVFVADHFIRPVLIGGAARLPFFWVLLGILGGFTAWGLVGLFVGPALMSALILLWRQWVGAETGSINPHPADIAPDPA